MNSSYTFLLPRNHPKRLPFFGVFLISISWAFFFLLLQRLIGIDEFFHPDAAYYFDRDTYSSEMLLRPNDGYVVFAKYALNYGVYAAIAINILSFSLCNYIISALARFKSYKEFFLLLALLL